jgi:hypothetical protein
MEKNIKIKQQLPQQPQKVMEDIMEVNMIMIMIDIMEMYLEINFQ